MRTLVNEPVSLVLVYDGLTKKLFPKRIKCHQTVYEVREVGFDHPVWQGRKPIHIYTVNVGALDMRLSFDGETRQWLLLEVSDGLAD